jgi:hypothetical protein
MSRLAAAPLVIVLTGGFYFAGVHAGWEARMASHEIREAYQNLVLSLRDEDGVTVDPTGLVVHGTLFAFLEQEALVVELPEARANDLVSRGVARRFTSEGQPSRKWVRVNDRQLWDELAHEAHEYVGEPPVGGQS